MQISEPDVVACTMVGRAHIGELGSQQAVAQAKEEIYVACPKALHIFNIDNEWTMRMQARSQAKQILFSSFKPTADVHMRAQKMDWNGLDMVGKIQTEEGRAQVSVLGRHNVVNLMCASALAIAAGLTPKQIWRASGPSATWPGTQSNHPMQNGARVLFDAYNANPDSVTALLKNLYEFEGAGANFWSLVICANWAHSVNRRTKKLANVPQAYPSPRFTMSAVCGFFQKRSREIAQGCTSHHQS